MSLGRPLVLCALVGCLLPCSSALLSVAPLQRLCYASSLAYCGGSLQEVSEKEYASVSKLRPVSRLVEPVTKSGVTILESTDEGDDLLVVAFRGSANLQNFVTNLRLSLVPLDGEPSARVHEGFQEASRGLWKMLDEELEVLQSRGERRAVFTGHSLGGATAQVCLLEESCNSCKRALRDSKVTC